MKFWPVYRRASLLVIVAVLWVACDSGSVDDDFVLKSASDYLPLEVGNYWEFKTLGAETTEVVQHREVMSAQNVNGRDYYVVVSHFPQNDAKDTVFYRIDDDWNVYTYHRGMENEQLSYKLLAEDGMTWSFPLSADETMDVTVNVETVETSLRKIKNCKSYYFDARNWIDEEHTNTLAPGVGFLKEFSNAWGGGAILSKASIGGHVIEF